MFARQVNLDTKKRKRNNRKKAFLTLEQLQKWAETINDIVFSAIKQRKLELAELYSKKVNKKYYILENIPVDTPVMVRLAEDRANKLAPLYLGPYVVVRRTQVGNYAALIVSRLLFAKVGDHDISYIMSYILRFDK